MNKLTLNTKEALDALKLAVEVSEAKGVATQQETLISVNSDSAELCATNSKTSIILKLPCESDSKFSFSVNCKALKNLFEGVSNVYAKAEIIVNEKEAEIFVDECKYKLPIVDVHNFPTLPSFTGEKKMGCMPAERLEALTKEVLPFVAKKESGRDRGALEKVFYKQTAENAVSVATCANKMIKTEYSDLTGGVEFSVLFGPEILKLSANAVKVYGGDCGLSVGVDGNIRLANKKFFIWGKHDTEEHYPDYEKVMPVECNAQVSIDKSAIVSAINKVGKQANYQGLVVIEFENDYLNLKTDGAETKISCRTHHGCKGKIGFNYKFLLDVIEKTSGNIVKFDFEAADKGVIINGQKSGVFKDTVTLLMPLKMSDGFIEKGSKIINFAKEVKAA